MAHFLIATMPELGHVHPALPVATALIARGHRVSWHCASSAEPLITASGARFIGWRRTVGFGELPLTADPGTRGRAATASALRRLLVDRMAGQYADYREIHAEDPVDAVLVDVCPLGARGLHERDGVPWASLGMVPLTAPGPDIPAYGTGRPPITGPVGRAGRRLANALARPYLRPATAAYLRERAALGLSPLPGRVSLLDHMLSPLLHLQAATPSIEYPRRPWPSRFHLVGPLLPELPGTDPLPAWWDDVRTARRVVHITQGTVADDPARLIRPALAALAGEDVLVVVTTRDPAELGTVPANARVTRFLPHGRLLPFVAAMVTNGGYAGTKMALAHGVPLVFAPSEHDKFDVAARIAWAGAGVDLRTATPPADALRTAVRAVLTEPSYRESAGRIRAEFARYPGGERAADQLERLARLGVAVRGGDRRYCSSAGSTAAAPRCWPPRPPKPSAGSPPPPGCSPGTSRRCATSWGRSPARPMTRTGPPRRWTAAWTGSR